MLRPVNFEEVQTLPKASLIRQICSLMVISQHFVKSSQEIRFKISFLSGETFGIWICYIGTTSSQGTDALVEGSLSNIGANKKLSTQSMNEYMF